MFVVEILSLILLLFAAPLAITFALWRREGRAVKAQDKHMQAILDEEAAAMSKAFSNIQARNGGQGVPYEEWIKEYGKVLGAKGCPCRDCRIERGEVKL